MNGNIFARLTGTQRKLLALLASSAMLTAGCANMATTASGVNSLTTSATLGGKVHGGNQPVSGATVNLYYAAQSTYSPATLAATTTTAADGSFSFVKNPTDNQTTTGNVYSCTPGDPVVYVVAKGGNPLNNGDTSVNNTAAAFIAIYGTCDELTASNSVDMTEVTTVATMVAAQQFFNPANDGLSADGTGQQKAVIVNLTNTIALMVNAATGTAVTSTAIPASTSNGSNGVTNVTVTSTPESAKINTLANILSACVNNASASAAGCSTLFANATPPNPAFTNQPGGTTFSPATDVLQAIYYILVNPTNGSSANLQNIYNLSPSVGAPYLPALAAAPTDWTVAISYSSTSNCSSSSGNFIYAPYDINIDAGDNVWLANSQAGTGNLSEIGANGAATTCVFLSGGSHGGATIDYRGNVWLATSENSNIYRYSTGVVPGGLPQGILAFATPSGANPLAVTADGKGNVYFTSSATGSLYQLPGAADAFSPVTAVQISNVVGPNPVRMMPDNQGSNTSNIWVTSGTSFVSRVTPSTSGPNLLGGYSTTTFPVGMSAYGVSVTNANGVFVSSNGADNLVTYLTGSGTNYSAPSGWPTATGYAGLNSPTALSIDGRNNVWVPNNATAFPGFGSVSEIAATSAALSPATTGFQKTSSFLTPGRASAVDQAGNIWIAGDGPTNYVTEIVGAGVPIYQPYAQGLKNGRFQSIP